MTRSAPDAPVLLGSGPGRLVLATVVLGSGMVFLDSTIVNVALDRIGQEFHTGFNELQRVLGS